MSICEPSFENFDLFQIFNCNQDNLDAGKSMLLSKAENSILKCHSQYQSSRLSETTLSTNFAGDSTLSETSNSLVIGNPRIIDEFIYLVMNELFMESKALLDSILTKDCKEYRIMSMSLLRLQLFNYLKSDKSDKIAIIREKIKAFDDDLTYNNGFLDCLIKNHRIFQTFFFSQLKTVVYLPALKVLAMALLNKEGLLPTYDFTVYSNDNDTIPCLRLLNIEAEMMYYMISYQRIYESTGEFNEIYLNFSTSFNGNDPSIVKILSDYISQAESTNIEAIKGNSKRKTIYTITKENPEKAFTLNSKKKSIRITKTVQEKSESTNENQVPDLPNTELLAFEFSGISKHTINKRVLKLFKNFLKSSAKAKEIDFSSETLDFTKNKLNPPLLVQGIKLKLFNEDYMKWLFSSNQQIAELYKDFKTQCFSFVIDKIVKTCKLLESKDILYLKAYINQLSALYCTELSQAISQPIKKRFKLKKHIKLTKKFVIFKIEQLPIKVKRNRSPPHHEEIRDYLPNNFEDTLFNEDISNLLSDMYHEFVFN